MTSHWVQRCDGLACDCVSDKLLCGPEKAQEIVMSGFSLIGNIDNGSKVKGIESF